VTDSAGALLEVRDVHKHFRIPSEARRTIREHAFGVLRPRTFRTLDVLSGVSFALGADEALGVMGANGAGKSTLLKILAGIYVPDRGEVVLRSAITPVLELALGWNPELDAVDNILLVGTTSGMRLAEARAAVREILAFAELEAFAGLALKHYSSGMAARLAYATAFFTVRDVLILDEIFAVGDAGFRERCERRFRELRQAGKSAILVSHTPHYIRAFCDRALLLGDGKVLLTGSPDQVADAYMQRLTGHA
jgi:ABC-type polysaccharide/polyol phosphate transport system ATPase subunit